MSIHLRGLINFRIVFFCALFKLIVAGFGRKSIYVLQICQKMMFNKYEWISNLFKTQFQVNG